MMSGAKPIWNKRPPLIIGIAGGSGAGKTWLAKRLLQRFSKEASLLSLDDFYRDRSHLSPTRRERINFDHPRSIDWPVLHDVLERCTRGESAPVPIYDFSTHTRRPEKRQLVPKSMLLVEGLWLFHRKSLRQFFDLSIFIDCPGDLRLRRRLLRDSAERGRTEESVRQQFNACVAPMHDRFIEPQRRWANHVFSEISDERIDALVEQIQKLTTDHPL